MFCSSCGNELVNGGKFCVKCGSSAEDIKELVIKKINKPYLLSEEFIKSDLFDGLIGKNSQYYRNHFLKMTKLEHRFEELLSQLNYFERFKSKEFKEVNKALANSSGFNWMSGLFNYFWFAYRKMYLQAIIILILEVILFFILEKDISSSIILMVISVYVFGKGGNQIYFKHLSKKLKLAKNEAQLINLGGTNFMAIWLIAILAFTLNLFVTQTDLSKLKEEIEMSRNARANSAFIQCLQSNKEGTECMGQRMLNLQR